MGTSSSSSGSPSGQQIVPDWTPPPPVGPPVGGDEGSGEDVANSGGEQPDAPAAPPPVILAPRARFAPARTHLGDFARSGSGQSMRRGVGHYVRKGLQGSRGATGRFGGSARTAGSLYGALSTLADGTAEPGSLLDRTILSGRSAREVISAIVEAVRPVDGTQDAEASRDAMNRALSAVLDQYPDADLLDLTEEQRLFATEHYLALDVFNRACLDIGKTIMSNAPSAASGLSRLNEIRDYIRETIAASFRTLRATGGVLSAQRVAVMARDALREAFAVFQVEAT
ncbi:MAG: hypothetical protein Kow0032_07800 [Methyloligellaceae bacterium]